MALKMVPLSMSASDESTMNAGCVRNLLSLFFSIFGRLFIYLSVIFCAHFVVPLSFFGLAFCPFFLCKGGAFTHTYQDPTSCKAAVCTVVVIREKRFTLGICRVTVLLWLSGLGIQGISVETVCSLVRYCRLKILLRRTLCPRDQLGLTILIPKCCTCLWPSIRARDSFHVIQATRNCSDTFTNSE